MTNRFGIYQDLISGALAEAKDRVFGDINAAERYGLSQYSEDPVRFSREVLGQVNWEATRYTMDALMKHHFVALTGCRKCSKSFGASELVPALVCTAPTICITTAATATQVRENMWAKIRTHHATARRPLPGKINTTSLRIGPEWYAIGMSTNQPGNIQGFHSGVELPAKLDEDALNPGQFLDADLLPELMKRRSTKVRLFFLIDEAAAIKPDIMETLFGSFAGDNVYVLMQFNPTLPPDSNHPAMRALRRGSGWHRIHISGEEFDDELEPDPADKCFHSVPEEIQPAEWRVKMRKEWGEDSALYRCHVLGLPAGVQLDRQFITHRLLEQQVLNAPNWKEDSRLKARHMGWDIAASEAGDFTVVTLWVAGMLVDLRSWRIPDTIESCLRVIDLMSEWGIGGERILSRNVHADAGGIGKALVNFMHSKGVDIDAVDFGSEPRGEWPVLCKDMEFVNYKAQLFWVFRRALQEGIACVPRKFSDVWAQAQWHTYEEVPRAAGTALKVAESKEDLKKLYGRSPDDFDAAVLGWARSVTVPGFSRA